jgi:DNA-binding LytR/AlgR family response regulator
VAIHKPGEKILTLDSMKKMEELLPGQQFVRVHKSYIVNIKHIDSIERNRIFIGKTVIPIGDTYRENLFLVLEGKK